MTKQEQIDEMAKVIHDRLTEARCWFGSMNISESYLIAQKLVEHYQPKLPEDGFVLSREEWEQIKNSLYYSKEELDKKLAQARKDTAKEICDLILEHWEKKQFVECDWLRVEIAEKYGVEVEECKNSRLQE